MRGVFGRQRKESQPKMPSTTVISAVNELKRRGRADKEAFISKLCRIVKDANHQNKSRLVYHGVKLICGRIFFRVGTIKDKNGTPLSNMVQIKSHWKEHFDELYNVKMMLHRDYYGMRWNGPLTT